MNRRTFQHLFASSLAGAWFGFRSAAGTRPAPVRPPRLRAGDTVGLITPGSYISDEGLGRAVRNLESFGFRVKPGRHISAERGFTAGTDAQRLEDLHAMFADPEVAGIWCARGGYGCSRLLPRIDYDLIRENPKALIGYSDITALHIAIHQRTGLITFHGPVGASEMTDYTRSHFVAVVMEGKAPHTIELSATQQAKEETAYQATTITPGRARGRLTGGNLSLLAALCGTHDAPVWENRLVFLEEVGEKPYRIDRMLTQLRQATDLDRAAALALGVFADCAPAADDRSLSLIDTLHGQLSGLAKPAVYGLSFGHIGDQCTLPLGVEAELDVENRRLRLLEAGVA